MDAAAGRGRGRAEVDAASGVRYGTSRCAGRVTSWPRSIAPPFRSPPTRLRSWRSRSRGPARCRARISVAEAGREALDLRLDRLGRVAVPAVRDVAVRPRGLLPGGRARVVEERTAGRGARTGAPAAGRPRRATRRPRSRRAYRRGGRCRRGGSPRRATGSARERPVELERARPVPVRAQLPPVALRQPVARDPDELARHDVGEHDVRRGSSSTASATRTEPPSRSSSRTRPSAIRCDPPRAKGQPSALPSTQSDIPKPALGRRSSGSIECAEWPAKNPRARWVEKTYSATSRADRSAVRAARAPRRGRARERARRRRSAAAGAGRAAPARPPSRPRPAGRRASGRPQRRHPGSKRSPRACVESTAGGRRRTGARPARPGAPIRPADRAAAKTGSIRPAGARTSRRRGGSRAASAPRCACRRRRVPPPRGRSPRARRARASPPPRARSAPTRSRPRARAD